MFVRKHDYNWTNVAGVAMTVSEQIDDASAIKFCTNFLPKSKSSSEYLANVYKVFWRGCCAWHCLLIIQGGPKNAPYIRANYAFQGVNKMYNAR